MKLPLLATALLLSLASTAQYYYKDIVGVRETTDLLRLYKANKVSRVTLTSFDETNTATEDFFVEQQFSAADNRLVTTTRSGVTNESVLITYADAQGRVTQTTDSSELTKNITRYSYLPDGRLLMVSSISTDTRLNASQTELHLWEYQNGLLSRMLRIKNGIDTTVVQMVLDENGNVIEERAQRKGVAAEPVQYFYDASNRLTDVVRFHARAGRLLPEYMFEYSPAGQVIQKITIPANNSNYLIWRYQYNAQGLKTKEAVYSKEDKRRQLGRVEYSYTFGS